MNINIPLIDSNTKSIDFSPWGGLEGFLAVSGNSTTDAQRLRKVVPWLNKAHVMTANAVSQLPYEIRRGEEILDPKTVWGGVSSPQTLIYKVAASLCGGAAYVLIDATARAIIDLRYLSPNTITPIFSSDTGELLGFNRDYNGKKEGIEIEKMLYFWLPDDAVEIGAAQITPLANALSSAGLLAAMDETLTIYGKRGFVPPMYAVAEGMPNKSELERAENVLSMMVRGLWARMVKIVNSKSLVPQKLGAGMEELKGSYIEITRQQIENIAAAFNIPLSLFLSNSANYATAVSDRRAWYESGLFVTLYQTIEDVFNQQLFYRNDAEMKFLPESIDAFQEEENDKSNSLASLSSTFTQYPEAAVIAADVLGYDLTDEQIADIRGLEPEEEEPPGQSERIELPTEEENAIAEEVTKWRAFAQKPRRREFDVKHIPPAMAENIRAGLRAAGTDAQKITAVFDNAVKGGVYDHDESAVKALAAAIEKVVHE